MSNPKNTSSEAEGAKNLSKLNFGLGLFLSLCLPITIVLFADSISQGFYALFLVFFVALGPYLSNSIFSLFVKKRISGIILLVLNVLYIALILCISFEAFFFRTEPHALWGIFLFGLVSLPFFLVIWILVFIFDKKH